MAEIVSKIPFTHAGEEFEVWVVRESSTWEFKIFVRKDNKPIAFVWDDEPPARLVYSVSFETEIDARTVMKRSVVAQAVSTAKADLAHKDYIVVSSE